MTMKEMSHFMIGGHIKYGGHCTLLSTSGLMILVTTQFQALPVVGEGHGLLSTQYLDGIVIYSDLYVFIICRVAGGCAQLCRQPLLGIRCQEILYLAHRPRFGQDHKRETVENTLISKLMYSSERSTSRANLIRTCAEFCDLKLSTSKSTVQIDTNYCTEILRRGARTTPAKCDQIKIDKSAKTPPI